MRWRGSERCVRGGYCPALDHERVNVFETIELELELARETRAERSPNVCAVAEMFGLGLDGRRTMTIVPRISLRLGPGRLVFVTGGSGGGKTSLLRLIESAVQPREGIAVVWCDRQAGLPDRPVVDCFDGQPVERVLRWLSLAGLAEAFVMLRRPCELSDGQRHRLALARVMMEVEQRPGLFFILADEFAATLDRTTAKVVSRHVRKWLNREEVRRRVCFVAATTHDDLLESLGPDVLVEMQPGGEVEIVERESTGHGERPRDRSSRAEQG